MESPLRIKIYDKDFNFKAFVGAPISVEVTPRFNQIGTATIVMDPDDNAVQYMIADGARVVFELRGAFLMSGKICSIAGQGPTIDSTLTFYVKDDFRLLFNVLAWPVPGAALTAQTSEYATYTGNAESIVKAVVNANMNSRLGMVVTTATNLGRGAVIADGVKFRFHPIYERLFPAVEQAGLGVVFKQVGAGIVCDVYEPPVYGRTLSEKSGVITSWAWTSEDPTASRVVAGGEGEGTARVFRGVANVPLEDQHNDVWEVFRDARDADTAAIVTSRAQESLDEGAPRHGFAVHLSETDNFQYGKNGLLVGAQVTVDLGYGTRTDILREVTLTYSRDEGLVTTPTIGEIQDSPDRTIAKFLARLKKGITDLKVSK